IDSTPPHNGSFDHTTCFVVDVSERRLAERRLLIEHSVARALSEAESLEEAGPEVLAAVLRGLDWDAAVLWAARRDTPSLQRICSLPATAAGELDERTEELAVSKGAGLAGQAWESDGPVWLAGAPRGPGLP